MPWTTDRGGIPSQNSCETKSPTALIAVMSISLRTVNRGELHSLRVLRQAFCLRDDACGQLFAQALDPLDQIRNRDGRKITEAE